MQSHSSLLSQLQGRYEQHFLDHLAVGVLMHWLSHGPRVSVWLWTQVVWSTLPVSQIEAKLLCCCFPGGASGKEPVCQFRSYKRGGFHPWVGKIPWKREWQPTPVFLSGESHRQRSLAGYNPWGHRVGHDWSNLGDTIFKSYFLPPECGYSVVLYPAADTMAFWTVKFRK